MLRLKTRKVITIAIGLCFLLALASINVGTTVAHRGHRTYFVSASGDASGITDTLRIQAAFDEAVEHRGSTVRLGRGTFYLNKEIVVVNFDGTFKGAGTGKTIIQNTEDQPFPLLSDPIFGLEGPQQVGFAQMFLFYQDADTESTERHPYNIKISDMTIRVVGESEVWHIPGAEWLTATSINPLWVAGISRLELIEDEVSYFNLFCHRLEMEGILSDAYFGFGSSAANGIQISGSNFLYINQLKGVFSVKHCSFKSICCGIVDLGVFKDSLLKIQHNTFDSVAWGMEVHPGNSLCIIAKNKMQGIGTVPSIFGGVGIYVEQWDPVLATILIYRNSIECADGATGMLLVDDSYLENGPITLQGFVFCNIIILRGPESVDILNLCSDDVKFYHNTVLGP